MYRQTHITGRYGILVLFIMSVQILLGNTNNTVKALTIQVCQNKDCCKRYKMQSMNLVQTLRNLLPPSSSDCTIQVVSTGCLSLCEKGPNLAIHQQDMSSNETPTMHNGITDHFSAAAVLPVEPPPTLLAAVSVMEKAEKGMYAL